MRARARLAAVVALVSATAPRAALAYVQTRTSSGLAYHWNERCITLEVYLSSLPGVSDAAMRAAVSAAARTWSADENPCTDLRIVPAFLDGAGPPPANDGHDVIGARPDGWCRPDAPPPPGGVCNAPSALAATTTMAAAGDGHVTGSDTELNTLTYEWAVLDGAGQPATKQDLQGALTHELGHLLGFDHPCWSGIGPHALDDQGQAVPDCYGAPEAITSDTMFPSTEPGDVSRRALSAEARRGLCAVYPKAAGATDACAARPDGGCRVASASSNDARSALRSLAVVLASFVVVLLLARAGAPAAGACPADARVEANVAAWRAALRQADSPKRRDDLLSELKLTLDLPSSDDEPGAREPKVSLLGVDDTAVQLAPDARPDHVIEVRFGVDGQDDKGAIHLVQVLRPIEERKWCAIGGELAPRGEAARRLTSYALTYVPLLSARAKAIEVQRAEGELRRTETRREYWIGDGWRLRKIFDERTDSMESSESGAATSTVTKVGKLTLTGGFPRRIELEEVTKRGGCEASAGNAPCDGSAPSTSTTFVYDGTRYVRKK